MFLLNEDVNKNNIAIKDEYGNKLTYNELDMLAEYYGGFIKERSTVAIICDFSIETLAFYYCCLKNRAAAILIGENTEKGLYNNIIKNYRPQYIWDKSADSKEKTVIETDKHFLLKTGYSQVNLNEDLALLLSTSGSTGSCKFVRLSYKNIAYEAEVFSKFMELKNNYILATTLPFNFSYGLCMIHSHWKVGAAVFVTQKNIIQQKFWDLCRENDVTDFPVIPYNLEFLGKLKLETMFYDKFEFIMTGGSRISDSQQMKFAREFKKNNVRFYIGYGQTETLGGLIGVSSENVDKKVGSIGLPCDKAIKVSLEDVGNDGIGELVIHGSCVFMGYADCAEDLAKGDENNGTIYTGDLAYMDGDGYIYLKGRKKRFVKILGVRTSLEEMEAIIAERFSNSEIICAGCDDKITIYHTNKINEQELKSFCKDKFNIHSGMISVKEIDEIKRNSYGKILYSEYE